MNFGPSLQRERDQRIAELESTIRRSSAVGVRIPLALTGLIASVALLALERKEIAYFFAPRAPIDLGVEGEYRLERLKSNRYAQLHGIPTLRAAYWRQRDTTFVLIGVLGTPILVRRPALAGEQWASGRTPPQPNQTPFAVRGRLLSAQDGSRYQDGFAKLAATGEIKGRPDALWILLEGERPASNLGALATGAALAAFFMLNLWLLWRAVQERFRQA
jgi:hypothetical protein